MKVTLKCYISSVPEYLLRHNQKASDGSLTDGLAHLPRGYRAAFFKEFPSLKPLAKKLEVHHELPQRTLKEDLFHPAEINDPHVMKGVTKEVHEAITTEWERFFFLNPNANRKAIIDQMQFIRNRDRSEMLP